MTVNMNSKHDHGVDPTAAELSKRRLRWWGVILLMTLVFAACLVTLALMILRPAFNSIDEVDLQQIDSMKAFVLNRPDGGPDLGFPQGIPIQRADFESLLTPLRKAKPINAERGVWLGRLTIKLQDGRSQSILLYRFQAEPKGPFVLRYKIGSNQYEAGPVEEFVQALVSCESHSQPSKQEK